MAVMSTFRVEEAVFWGDPSGPPYLGRGKRDFNRLCTLKTSDGLRERLEPNISMGSWQCNPVTLQWLMKICLNKKSLFLSLNTMTSLAV